MEYFKLLTTTGLSDIISSTKNSLFLCLPSLHDELASAITILPTQVLVNASGIPVEFGFVPGCESDLQALKKLPLAVAAESKIYGDAAYTDYQIEDQIKETDLIELMIQRKSNSKRADQPWIGFIKEQMRKGIETFFSKIKALFLRTIHAVTLKGF